MGNSSSQEEETKKASSSSSSASSNRKRDSAAIRSLQQQVDSKIPTVTQPFDGAGETAAKPTSSKSEPRVIAHPSTDNQHVEHVESTAHDEDDNDHHAAAAVAAAAAPAANAPARPQFIRRKSAIVLETEDEVDQQLQKMSLEQAEGTPVRSTSMNRLVGEPAEDKPDGPSVDVTIEWKQGGRKVYVTGSFTGWRKMIKLNRQEDGHFSTTLKLPLGTHRLRFVVDNEMRCSDFLQTATDSMGNLVNYIVVDHEGVQPPLEEQKYEQYKDDENVIEEPKFEYCKDIPEVFTNPEVMDRFVSSEFVTPPQLPPHLEGVILNSNSGEKDNSSVLPIPNHVVLNHLATTSIKHNVLAVASISRYSRKYVTQVLYAPL